MNGFGNQFLACSGFPVDQDRGVGRSHDPHHGKNALESRASAYNPWQTFADEFVAVERAFRRLRILDFKGCGMADCRHFTCPDLCCHSSLPSVVRDSGTRTCLTLTFTSFSRDPLAGMSWAIPELDAVRFTPLKKPDCVPIHQGQVFQIQNYLPSTSFGFEK